MDVCRFGVGEVFVQCFLLWWRNVCSYFLHKTYILLLDGLNVNSNEQISSENLPHLSVWLSLFVNRGQRISSTDKTSWRDRWFCWMKKRKFLSNFSAFFLEKEKVSCTWTFQAIWLFERFLFCGNVKYTITKSLFLGKRKLCKDESKKRGEALLVPKTQGKWIARCVALGESFH